MKTAIKNPWFRKDGPYSVREYVLDGAPIFSYRGVDVYKRSQSWMYVLGDTAITERAGFDKAKAPSLIDDLLDGHEASSDNVVSHLRANGHKGLSYDEYDIEYKSGRMA